MKPELVSDLTFLNTKRNQELDIRFGPSVRSYASPLNHFFLHALESGALRKFSFFVARDGRILIRDILRLREGVIRRAETPIAFHYSLMDEIPEDLRKNVSYYRFKTFHQDDHKRPYLLNLLSKDSSSVSGYERTFTLDEITHETIYRQEIDFSKFDFRYGTSVEDFTGDCFLQFQLLRFGARRIDEPDCPLKLRLVKQVTLSFRHCIEILKLED